MISHLGAMISVVNGVLMAERFKKMSGHVGAASIGDGGTSTGSFHEGLNQAAVEKLPLVLVVANNQYAYSTPNHRQFACASLLDKAAGYGVTGHEVDGTDLEACLQTVGEAVARARQGLGPQMVVARLLRLCGHGEHDDASYIDARLKASPLGRDCLQAAEELMWRRGWADEAATRRLAAGGGAIAGGNAGGGAKGTGAGSLPGRLAPLASRHLMRTIRGLSRVGGDVSMTYLEAIRAAQAKALAEDPRVFIYGQDVGAFGGAFKATKNLAEEFPGRVLDAPISEDAMVGAAIGAAIEGMRPIIEMQFADFSTPGLNQIVNQAATLYWRTQVPCPITIRLPSGGTSGGGSVPQPEHGGDLRALSRIDRDDAGDGGGRLQHVAGGGGD